MRHLKSNMEEEERRNAGEIEELKRDVEREKLRGSKGRTDKENINLYHNSQCQLEHIKGVLKKAEEDHEPKLSQLA